MALFDCVECGYKVSETAKTCPNCGFNIRKEQWKYIVKSSLDEAKKEVDSQSSAYKFFKKISNNSLIILFFLGLFICYRGEPLDLSNSGAKIFFYIFLVAVASSVISNFLYKKN